METESKRRRINLNEDDGIDESEDVKMEQFFALIRKAKDIRDQLLGIEPRKMSEKRQLATTTTAKEDKGKGKGKGAVWQPCFEPGDFGVVVKSGELVNHGNVAGCSKTSEEVSLNKAEEEHVNIISTPSPIASKDDSRILLDLNLSLSL